MVTGVRFSVGKADKKYMDESVDIFARVTDGVASGDNWRVSDRERALLAALFDAVLDGWTREGAAFKVPEGIESLAKDR